MSNKNYYGIKIFGFLIGIQGNFQPFKSASAISIYITIRYEIYRQILCTTSASTWCGWNLSPLQMNIEDYNPKPFSVHHAKYI